MEKFLNIPVYVLLASGTTTTDGSAGPGGPDKLIDAGATFTLDGINPGDIIHQSTDDTFFTVVAVDNDTTLSVSPPGIDTAKDYYIHSATETADQLVSAVNVIMVEQRLEYIVYIHYDGPGAADLITLTHEPVPVGDESPRNAIQDLITAANQTHWKDVVTQAGTALEVAGTKVIGISIS
jgi:hypothetical protein